jgi:hypothetical protein
LRDTSDYCITYNSGFELVCGYVDYDFARDMDKMRSTSRYVFTLASGAISWMSKLQRIASLSTTEAKYIASSHACKEAVWLKGLFGEFGRMQDKVKLLCDSQSAIHLANNPTYHSKTKHIPIKYNFVRQVMMKVEFLLKKFIEKRSYVVVWLLLACIKGDEQKKEQGIKVEIVGIW